MASDDKKSGIRGRIDRFFDRRAKEQQDLLRGEIGGKNLSESWEQAKERFRKSSPKAKAKSISRTKDKSQNVDEESNISKAVKRNKPEVEISPLARSFVKLTTDYPPATIGIMTVIMLIMLLGIGKTNINGAMEVYLP